MAYEISSGFDTDERPIFAALYWQAFGYKLGRVLGPDPRAREFLCAVIDPAFALVARGPDGRILGIAGFKTAEGALVGGDFKDLQAVYGTWGAVWRGLTLSVVERDVAPDVLLMDGICVHESARGLGVGTALLGAVKSQAQAMGKPAVRLDVIDSNPRAKALYLREGFVPHGIERTGPFRHVFRFKSATQMLWQNPAK
ncbi:GNAT family N-acetyltransferase [Roseobacter sp. MH60115]|uniref:GNAT family N-acetyltransferase n=1 Tax=Roseobacter sp. MH60115 TaxID=2785324 RepID=UPI0018A3276F|nr:GNAT family N-acetyltransferase [Roseobacter sp. MH60115]